MRCVESASGFLIVDFARPDFGRLGYRAQTHDADIRRALANRLASVHALEPDTAFLSEFGVEGGSARIDVAVVNCIIHGYELKSDCDTLLRLSHQSDSFGRVCDCLTLVVGEKYVRRAADMLPDWWGISVARQERDGVIS